MKLLLHVRRTDVTSYGGPHAPPIEALVPAMNRFFDRTLGPVRAEMTRQLYKTAYQTSGWQGVLRERAKWLYEYNLAHSFFSACINAQIGEKDKAFEYLEKSYQERELWMAYLQVDPRLDSLRDDPRFDELVRRVGLK